MSGSSRVTRPAASVVGDDTVLLRRDEHRQAGYPDKKTNGQLAAEEFMDVSPSKPDFTDFVILKATPTESTAHFYLRGSQTGERKWKGGRYGKGQVLLLENSGLLLVSAEDGRVVLLRADPGEHAEVASFVALEGKTWNHPVVVGDRLYVRMLRRRPVTSCRWQKRKRLPHRL